MQTETLGFEPRSRRPHVAEIAKATSSEGQFGFAVLNLKGCKSLVCLPDTIHGLNSLRILDISGCSKLSRLPVGLKEIKCLEELHASDTAIDELPSSVIFLDNLKVLSFVGCKGPLSKSMNWFLPFNSMLRNQPAPTGFRFPPSVWSLPSLRHINLSYCNLSEESIPDYFCHLSSLVSLDLTGNNFVRIPSCISKLSGLKILTLNRCRKLQLLPELPSSIIQLDASNCNSLETNKFNPAKPCSLFASPIQQSFTGELFKTDEHFKSFMEGSILDLSVISLKLKYLLGDTGLYLSSARFDMLIPGYEIPSWFVPQRFVSWAKIQVPNNCPVDGWVGFALCFRLVSYDLCFKLVSCGFPPELCNHEVDCYLFAPDGKQLISTRRLPPMDLWYPRLYILYLSIDQFRNKILEDDY